MKKEKRAKKGHRTLLLQVTTKNVQHVEKLANVIDQFAQRERKVFNENYETELIALEVLAN